MAKGQVRSNREVRKPKKSAAEKAAKVRAERGFSHCDLREADEGKK